MASSKLQLILSRLSSAAQTQRCYNTSTRAKRSLYSKISPLGSPNVSVKPELDNWVEKGKKVYVAELRRIIYDLRKHKRFSQALQVSEWMNEKDIVEFSPSEHAVRLDLIGRVHGFLSAENYFHELADQNKTAKTYGALLNCYLRQRQSEKFLSHFQRMKEMGFASTTLAYNNLMCLYTYTNHHDKVPQVLSEMKQNSVLPDNYSYRFCIGSFGVQSDLEGMEKILSEMETQSHILMDWNTYAVAADFYVKAGLTCQAVEALKKAEVRLDKKDGESYNFLISLYSKLGKTDEVLRLWELEKSASKRCINKNYMNVLTALVRLGELEEAHNILAEWEASGNLYDLRVPDILVAAYRGKKMFEKAEEVLKGMASKALSPKSSSSAAEGTDTGEMQKATRTGIEVTEGF
ncbi:hypothetical protein Dimus_035214 [Dionaea muscipula]